MASKSLKKVIRGLVPDRLWSDLRRRRILRRHAQVVQLCEQLIEAYDAHPEPFDAVPKQPLTDGRTIWQYWAQGWDQVPAVVAECMASVDRYAGDYRVVRLCDANLEMYIDLPDGIRAMRSRMTTAHFSDLLRLMLLKTYGGLWLDATVMMSGPVPPEMATADFFVYRRDPAEPNQKFWEHTYAYYFDWHPDFKVRMLNSIMAARRGTPMISYLCNLMFFWWNHHDGLPDYFFFQILFEVLVNGRMRDLQPPVVSDCLPHCLQQVTERPDALPLTREEILARTPFHKLTYKYE